MNKPTLTLSSGHILVEFEEKPKMSATLDLVAPERFLVQEAEEEGETNAWAVTTDRRTINPQIVNVIIGDDTVPTDSRCFVHYGCFEIGQWYNDKQCIIRANMVFFMLDPIKTFQGNYLGEEVFVEGEKTESGIYTTPIVEEKLPCNIVITHIPDNSSFAVGDEVITIDGAQYTLNYNGKKYIKLRDSEIIAKVVDKQVVPVGKYLLVEYMDKPNPELTNENDYKAHMKDVAIKHRLFVPGIDFTPTEAPKHVDAKILAVGPDIKPQELYAQVDDKLLINRNRGLRLPDGKWIINLDAILCVYEEKKA